MRRSILPVLAVSLALPGAAMADTQLERLESISENANEVMMSAMVMEMSMEGEARDNLMALVPDMQWDAPMREAGECMLDLYEADIGADGVEDMLTMMEDVLAEAEGMSIDEFADLGDSLPEGMTDQRSAEITRECGMLDLQMQKMDESGFMDAMMQAAMAADN